MRGQHLYLNLMHSQKKTLSGHPKAGSFQNFCSEPGKIIHSLVKAGHIVSRPCARALRGFARVYENRK